MLPSIGRGRARGRGRGRSPQPKHPPHCNGVPREGAPGYTSQRREPLAELPQRSCTQPARESTDKIPKLDFGREVVDEEIKGGSVHLEGQELQLKYNLDHQPPLPRRPGEGTLGRKLKLISNCYPINIPSGCIYHYNVVIEEQNYSDNDGTKVTNEKGSARNHGGKRYRRLNTKLNREIVKLMLQVNKNFCGLFAAYDGGNNLYTRHELECEEFPLVSEIQTGNPVKAYEITINPVKKSNTDSCAINLDVLHALFKGKAKTVSREAVMAVETILSQSSCLKYIPVGRSFFYPPDPDDLHPLGGGREIWFGFHQSLRLGQWKPFVNLDVTATTFYKKGPVLEFIANILKMSIDILCKKTSFSDWEKRKINRELKGMQIETNHLRSYKRKYRIIRLAPESANNLEFSLVKNGVQRIITIKEYYIEQYGRELQYPHLPCLQVNPEKKQVYLPMEICCIIEGQHCKKKLDERQNAEMIRRTARKPEDRFREIKNIMSKINFTQDPYLKAFDINVNPYPLVPLGRVIESPTLEYRNHKTTRPRDGSWDIRGIQFLQPVEIKSWALLCFVKERECDMRCLNRFSGLLKDIACKTGIAINSPLLTRHIDPDKENISNLLRTMKQNHGADLVVIVLPDVYNSIRYKEIKKEAETVVGLVTQCVKEVNVVQKCTPTLISNLCHKINSKLGGVNNALLTMEKPSILQKPVIIIGADVNHSIDESPSIAAAVGSLDFHPSRYSQTIRAQTNPNEGKRKMEVILDLKSMVVDLLKAFYRATGGKKPEKIIFYRDGVSEGELAKVKEHEVRSIREACRSLGPEYEPGITFIVVQKRHHVRFRPDFRDGVGKMKNIPPGTVVDNTVVHPLHFDFFLCSHYGLQGTSRPAYYTVVEDDNDMSADDIYKMTYYLCHMFVRCPKSISIPAPVQYADLAAYRARLHLESQSGDASSSSSRGSGHCSVSEVQDAIRVVDVMKNSMYFV